MAHLLETQQIGCADDRESSIPLARNSKNPHAIGLYRIGIAVAYVAPAFLHEPDDNKRIRVVSRRAKGESGHLKHIVPRGS
jgi:hypothetical protein